MVIRPVVIAVLCIGFFLILESLMLPKALALKTSGFRMQDQRTYKRRNYMLQRARDKEILKSLQKRGVSYTEIEPLDAASTIPERLAYIVDYANTIDDEYYLDKSDETRTRKRGDSKIEKHNQTIPDPPCTCDYDISPENLGDNVFPRTLYKRVCRQPPLRSCAFPYECQEISYEMPILKKISNRYDLLSRSSKLLALVPNHLNISWYAELINLAVGCQCVKEIKRNTKPIPQK